jgi:RNA polymerase sigma-70 factor (ECF subfamily)
MITEANVRRTLTEADRMWFAERVDAVLPDLYGRALRLCRDSTQAEDLAAEAVARAWAALPSLESRAAFRSWVFRILNNTFLSMCRTAQWQAEHEPLDGAEEEFSLFERLHQPFLLWWGDPERVFLNRVLREDLERAISGLPDPFRVVVVLVDVQGLTYRDAAELLDVPVGTVRSRLARARSALQKALWMHGREAGLTAEHAQESNEVKGHDD